jgi:hypothetical protein
MPNTSSTDRDPDRPRLSVPDRLLWVIALLMKTGDPHATIDRLFTSKHVRDLRWIVAGALVILLAVVGIVAAHFVLVLQEPMPGPSGADMTIHPAWSAIVTHAAYITPVLGVFGVVLAWAYQIGSARLGVVDLFACEISTLCRVVTIFDTVGHRVDAFNVGPPHRPVGLEKTRPAVPHFTSQESYFPIFETCSRDLQILEANVVINITEFYTYMKAVRDLMRALAEIRSKPIASGTQHDGTIDIDPWHDVARNLLYALFLALESARKAVRDLVEFVPEQAERMIVILLSELQAYRFLRNQYTDASDMHLKRIALREPIYNRLVPDLCRTVKNASEREAAKPAEDQKWSPAAQLLDELSERYESRLTAIA